MKTGRGGTSKGEGGGRRGRRQAGLRKEGKKNGVIYIYWSGYMTFFFSLESKHNHMHIKE